MNGIQTVAISDGEVNKILAIEEGHFTDVKAIETLPAGLTRAIAALSNAEGGELFIGIDEHRATKKENLERVCKSGSSQFPYSNF